MQPHQYCAVALQGVSTYLFVWHLLALQACYLHYRNSASCFTCYIVLGFGVIKFVCSCIPGCDWAWRCDLAEGAVCSFNICKLLLRSYICSKIGSCSCLIRQVWPGQCTTAKMLNEPRKMCLKTQEVCTNGSHRERDVNMSEAKDQGTYSGW